MAPDHRGRILGRNVAPAAREGHDQFGLEMQIPGCGRIGHVGAAGQNRIGGLAEKERIGGFMAHLARMVGVIAPHAEDAPHGKPPAAGDRDKGAFGRGNDEIAHASKTPCQSRKPLISMGLPLGSVKNIVRCSPGSP